MPGSASSDPKSSLRETARERRREAFLHFGDRFGTIVAANFFARFSLGPDHVIAGYWPVEEEADTRVLMAALADRGHGLALPAVLRPDAPLGFLRWRPGDPLHPGYKGIPEPDAGASALVPDLVLVPLLGFDARGFRLGYGGGFYDRTLQELRKGPKTPRAVGIAFSAQELDAVPNDPHDQPLDWVVTETGTRAFGGQAEGKDKVL